MTNRNIRSGELLFLIIALAFPGGCYSGPIETQDREESRSADGRELPETQDIEEIRNAAERGDADAQNELGVMYDNGSGVPQDFLKAYAWLILATAQGHKEADKSRDDVAVLMLPEQVSEAQTLSTELRERIESSRSE